MYTLQGKTWSTHHTFSTLYLRMVPDHTPPVAHIVNLSLVHTKTKQTPTPGISLGNQIQTGPVVISSHLIPSPSRQPWSRGERYWPSGDTATSAYWAHNTSMQSVRSILACAVLRWTNRRSGQPDGTDGRQRGHVENFPSLQGWIIGITHSESFRQRGAATYSLYFLLSLLIF
jgi:hypothetical protein